MSTKSNSAPPQDHPWEQAWPADGLEPVPRCPACGSNVRKTLHPRLVDRVFRCAPGVWTLQECADCCSAYLDPRPTPETISLAYRDYYTHYNGASKLDYFALSPLRKLRRRLVNGYTNRRFGTTASPASPLGPLIARLLHSKRRVLERVYRNLPAPGGHGRRLLDLGCGDGAFLTVAASCGWHVEGLDPDPHAVTNAARRNLTVHLGGIEHFEGQSALFDFITLSHVIEHLYEPTEVLRACHRLLQPGGMIWIETPNIASQGHRLFGVDWFALDPPRHLVLFNRSALHRALVAAGFSDVRDAPRPSACPDQYKCSHAMSLGLRPDAPIRIPLALRLRIAMAKLNERIRPDRREFLTVLACKAAR